MTEQKHIDDNIAYICLCHADPEFIARVAKVLQYKNDGFFIHVDAKVNITPFLNACSKLYNVHFVQNRIKNYWGGMNSVIATVETLKLAKKTGSYSRFILLQGQDYPLFSPMQIHEFFKKNQDVEYCKAKDITISKNKGDYMKWAGYHVYDTSSNNFFTKCLRFALLKLNRLGIKYRRGTYKHKKEKWHIYHGWAQFALTSECIDYIIDFYDNTPSFNKFIKHRFPPDEIYFHTIIHNSKYKNNVSKDVILRRSGEKTLINLTYFEYPVAVTLFTEKEDYSWLKNTGCLFVRKVNSSSEKLLDEIDRMCAISDHIYKSYER